jgi:hypothetical protein
MRWPLTSGDSDEELDAFRADVRASRDADLA